MKRLAVLAGVTAALTIGRVEAGAQQPAIWIPPACKLNTKHFLVNSAQLYLKNATQAKAPEQRNSNLKDANRVLNEAVTTGGQIDNPAIWYFFGRYYLIVEDMAGADSSFRKAEEGAADCKDDIEQYRRLAWVPQVQAAADALNNADLETAKVHFRKANAIYQGDPLGFYYLANVFTNQGQLDSATYYYRRTLDLANQADTAQRETYETSMFNLARLYHQEQTWDSAVAWYEKYRQEKPGDMQAAAGLAVVYAEAAKAASAAKDEARAADLKTRGDKLYDGILAQVDSVPMLDLFSLGISLFSGGDYERASRAFQGVLKKSPYYRDALYNLASTYLSMGSVKDTTIPQAQRDAQTKQIGEQMLPVTKRMVEVDGHNRNTLRMLAVAYQYMGMNDSVLAMLTAAEGLPFEINVGTFQPTQTGHQLRGTVTALEGQVLKTTRDSLAKDSTRLADLQKTLAAGRDPKTNRPLAPAIKQALQGQEPVLQKRVQDLRGELERLMSVSVPPITFEFLNQGAQVVAAQTVPGMTLAPNANQDFELSAVGEGIVSWRYKVGG